MWTLIGIVYAMVATYFWASSNVAFRNSGYEPHPFRAIFVGLTWPLLLLTALYMWVIDGEE